MSRKYSEIKYIHQKNKGPAAARNIDVKAAKGGIMDFIDSDVIAHKELMPRVLKSFDKNKNAGGIEGRVIVPGGLVKKTRSRIMPGTRQAKDIMGILFFQEEKIQVQRLFPAVFPELFVPYLRLFRLASGIRLLLKKINIYSLLSRVKDA